MKQRWYRKQIQALGLKHLEQLGSTGKRPEFNVVLVEDEGLGKIVVKQFDPRADDGCIGDAGGMNGFIRSLVVPRAAWRIAEKHGIRSTPFGKVLDRFHLPPNPSHGFPWYFTMKFYDGDELDWSNGDDVQKALSAISQLQEINVKELQQEISEMEDVPLWATESALFEDQDFGTARRYSGNISDSIGGLVGSGFTDDAKYRSGLNRLVLGSLECLNQALSAAQEPLLVLSHRDTGKPNFQQDSEGEVVLIDWEHCRLDNPLSDYTHLWLQLAGDDFDDAAAATFWFMKDRYAEQPWFEDTFQLCIAEKILGNTNHKVTHSETDAVEAVSVGLERMDWALGMVAGQ